MSRTARSIVSALIVSSLAIAVPAVALAASSGWETAEVALHVEGADSGVVVITGHLPEGAPLPADVRLTAPPGATLQWVGEILGGDPQNDPSVEPKVTSGKQGDVYAFRLAKARIGQLEVVTPGSVRAEGDGYVASLAWVPLEDLKQVEVGLRLPVGAKATGPVDGFTLETAEDGAAIYRRTLKDVGKSDEITVAVAFTMSAAGAAGTAGAATTSAGGSAPPLLFLLVAAIGAAGIVYAVYLKARRRPADDDTEDVKRASRSSSKASDASTAAEPKRGGKGRKGIVLAIAAVMIIPAAFVALAAVNASAPQASGDSVTKTYAQGEACATAVIPLSASAEQAASGAQKLFTAVQSVPGIVSATVYYSQPRIEIGYCESSSSEAQLRQLLAATGMVDASGASTESSAAPTGTP